MIIRKCYPGGKKRAFNITYDDGVRQDMGMVSLLNDLGLKGTFNLNSRLMETEFQWRHACGMTVRRLPFWKAPEVYKGHEVACHTLTHPYLTALSRAEALWQMREDKRRLEVLFGREIRGFALPFYDWNEEIRACTLECGFSYARISEESRSYSIPDDFHSWRAGMFHLDPHLREFVMDFLRCEQEQAICQIVGHSYDLDVTNGWERMADLLRMVARDPDTASMTHIELVDYLRAMECAVIGEKSIDNESRQPLWFRVDGKNIMVEPNSSWSFEEK